MRWKVLFVVLLVAELACARTTKRKASVRRMLHDAGRAQHEGKGRLAAKYYMRALKAWGPRTQSPVSRGIVHFKLANVLASTELADYEKAAHHYKAAVQLEPYSPEPVVYLAHLLKRLEGREDERLQHLERAVALGVLNHVAQLPMDFHDGLFASPWHLKDRYSVAAALESNYQTILQEYRDALHSAHVNDKSQYAQGTWKEISLHHHSAVNEHNCALMPTVCGIMMSFPDVISMGKGAVKISTLGPGTAIAPHVGPTNARVRLHLGLEVPAGASITVGGERREWQEGQVLAFDDSFEHSVINEGRVGRTILIMDVWHPDLSGDRRINSLDASARALYRSHLDMHAGWQEEP